VRLNGFQLRWAKDVADLRNTKPKGPPRFGYAGDYDNPTNRHFQGCCGEQALCEILGVPWPARVDTYRELPDVDPDWEVRWSSGPRLKVTSRDNLFYRAVLVMGNPPVMKVVGWMRVATALSHYPVTDPGDRKSPATFVPAADLNPFDA
jgi:hypothetical protein